MTSLWDELNRPGFDPERSGALPGDVAPVAWRELARLIGWRVGIFLALAALAIVAGYLFRPLAALGLLAPLPLCRIPPSRRWTNAVLLAVDLSSDLPPDAVARCLLQIAEGDRFLYYKASRYARPTLHHALENALNRTRDFVATERECSVLLHLARSRRYPVALRIARSRPSRRRESRWRRACAAPSRPSPEARSPFPSATPPATY